MHRSGAAAAIFLVCAVLAGCGENMESDSVSSTTRGVATTTVGAAAANLPRGHGDVVLLEGKDVATGAPLSLASLRGKPTVVAIWASWCPGCNEEAEHLAAALKGRDDVNVIGVDYRDTSDEAAKFTSKYSWTFPSIADPDGEVVSNVGFQGTPTTLLLDAEHREIDRIVGPTDTAGFTEAFDRITGS